MVELRVGAMLLLVDKITTDEEVEIIKLEVCKLLVELIYVVVEIGIVVMALINNDDAVVIIV